MKLPDFTAMGDNPQVRPAQGIASYDATTGMEGAGAAALSKAGSEIGGAAETFAVMKDRQDTLRAEDAYNQLRKKQVDMTYGPQGFANLKGGDAVNRPLFKEYGGAFDQAAADVASTLDNDYQKQLFQRRAEVAGLQLRENITRHVAQEQVAYGRSVNDATVKTEVQNAGLAGGNELDFQMALHRANNAIDAQANAEGLKPTDAPVVLAKQTALDQANSLRVKALLGVDPMSAEALYKQVEPTLTPQTRIVLGHELKVAVTPIKAKLIADKAMTATDADTLGNAIKVSGDAGVQSAAAAVTGTPQPAGIDSVFQGVLKAESSKPTDISPKGAFGSAQILEGTGRHAAQHMGIPFDLNKFRDDDAYRTTLAKDYLQEQLDYFGGNRTLAFAAYNAGPARVNEWVKKYGDPRTGAISDADWAAKIPFEETRKYVPRALAAAGQDTVAPVASAAPSGNVIPVSLGTNGTPTRTRDTRAMLGQWIAEGERQAQAEQPDDPAFRDMVVQNIKGKVATIVQMQEGIQRQAQGALIQASIGMNNTLPPTTTAELFSIPGARDAFTLMDEASQRGILSLIDHNARTASGENVRSNPIVVQTLFNRIHADENDPQKIRSVTQLAQYFGPDSRGAVQLNRADYDWMGREIEKSRNPEGNAFLRDVNNVRNAANRIMRAGIMGRMLADTQPEKIEEASYAFSRFLDGKIEEYRKAGKEPRDLLNPAKPDYVLAPGTVQSFLQTPQAALGDAANRARANAGESPPVKIAGDADYNKLPKGARYVGPDGVPRVK